MTSFQNSIPAHNDWSTSTSAYRSTIRPGRPSDSAWMRRSAEEVVSLSGNNAFRVEMARSIRCLNNSAPTDSCSSKVQTRARICEFGLYAARARNCPSAARTSIVAPRVGFPSMRATAPEKTHGWRRRSDFSRPGLRRIVGINQGRPYGSPGRFIEGSRSRDLRRR